MNLQTNVNLAAYSTMRLGGRAAYFCAVSSRQELAEAAVWAQARQLPCQVIGSGSNIIWRDEGFPGLVIVNQLAGFETRSDGDDTFVIVGAGENWDSVVARTVTAGLTGLEALSLIPGTVGATPVQNVGAYGQEIADTLYSLEVYDQQTNNFTTLATADCNFGYRTSRFKTTDRGRFLITSLTFRLQRSAVASAAYPAVADYLQAHAIMELTPATIRQAVIAIRSQKLPDPATIGNTGSFFANPIITTAAYQVLAAKYADIPHWPVATGVKIAGAWLIEQAGFKDYHDEVSGMATWGNQPLVLVNEAATSTADLLNFKQKIVDGVAAKFDIRLEQEPELLP